MGFFIAEENKQCCIMSQDFRLECLGVVDDRSDKKRFP